MEIISNKSPLLKASWEHTELPLPQTRGRASPAGLSFGCCTQSRQWPTLKGGASHKLLWPGSGLALRGTLKKSLPIMLQNDLQ